MALLGSLVVLSSLCIEILALKYRYNVPLKMSATLTSIGVLAYFLFFPPPGSFMTIWPLGMNIYGLSQRCINYLWLKDPHELVRKKDEGPAKGTKPPAISTSDALEISTTFRGVGWRFQAKGLPVHPLPRSRSEFVFSQISGAILRFLVLDLAISCTNSSLTTISDASVHVRLAYGCLMMFYVRWTMDISCRLLSATTVLFGIFKPDDWPPLFGEWRDAYTLRRFWSHTWHQGMRLIAEPPVEFLINVAGLGKQSYSSRWAKIFGNFTMAFFDHAYGRILAGGNPLNDWTMFMLQPIAIWTEETIREVAVAAGLLNGHYRSQLVLGYVFVLVFQSWTFLDFMEGAIRWQGSVPLQQNGLIEPAFGLSVVRPLFGLGIAA